MDTQKNTIAFDPGFGNTKAAYVNGKLTAISLPSVVGVGQTDVGLLSVGSSRRRVKTPSCVEFEGVSYLVGENVAQFARPVERMDFQRLSDGPELRALFYTALHRLLGPGTHSDIRVMVALPVEVMNNRQQALQTRKELRRWMIGEHDCTIGQPIKVQITRVEVMAQPAGSYFCWGMNDRGAWQRGTDSLQHMISICDIGFNTVDLFVVQGGNVVARYTGGQTSGMRRAAELIIETVRKQYGVALSLHEADALLRERYPTLSTSEGVIDLKALTEQARETVASSVLMFTERTWGNAKQFRHVLFTGGGADALRDTLSRHYPHGIVLPEAVTANAAGLAKYGQRVGR